jgi:hypothetical protein
MNSLTLSLFDKAIVTHWNRDRVLTGKIVLERNGKGVSECCRKFIKLMFMQVTIYLYEIPFHNGPKRGYIYYQYVSTQL